MVRRYSFELFYPVEKVPAALDTLDVILTPVRHKRTREVDHLGIARYPLLPDDREAVELDFFDFVLEERDTYWHIDTDRYAAAVLQAPRVAGRTGRRG